MVGGTVYRTLYVWDTSGEVVSGPLQGHTDDLVIHLCFVSDDIVLSSSLDATVRQWNIRTGEPIGEAFNTHGDPFLEGRVPSRQENRCKHHRMVTYYSGTWAPKKSYDGAMSC